jgi:hypothetical protein
MKPLPRARIDEFKATFRGDVLLPGDAGYDEVRRLLKGYERPALANRSDTPHLRVAPHRSPACPISSPNFRMRSPTDTALSGNSAEAVSCETPTREAWFT